MQSNTRTPHDTPAGAAGGGVATAAPPDEQRPPTVADGIDALDGIATLGRQAHDVMVGLIDAVAAAKRSGTVEYLQGLPLDLHLTLTLGLPSGDVAMLLAAADVLPTMPTVDRLFRDRRLSWGLVRGLLTRVRRLRVAERAILDDRIGASIDFIDALSPEQLWDAADAAVDEIRGARAVEQREARRAADDFLYGQLRLDGSASLYGELCATSTATLFNALEARAGSPEANSHEPGTATTRSRQMGKALVDMAADDLGRDDPGRPAAPAFTVRVDTKDVTVTEAGLVEINLPGAIAPGLSAALVESLLGSATVKAVLFDGARPLAWGRKINLANLPDDIRDAVGIRDGGDRFPGSRQPLARTDAHHINGQRNGHHPEGLVRLSRKSHRLTHKHRWRISVDPDSGKATFTRGTHTFTTMPWGTRLRRPPPADPGQPQPDT